MMVVADDAGDFPGAIFVLPEVNKAGLAYAFGVLMPGVMETVDTHFDRTISLHVVDLQCSGDEFARRFAANVFLYAVCERHLTESDAALIVVELDIVGKERRKLFKVAAIVGIEESSIECRYGFVQLRLGFDAVERWHGLSGDSRDKGGQQK